ncbi:MAG: hypothetical protein ABIN89_19845 [Chitinophagaceae bacterium]
MVSFLLIIFYSVFFIFWLLKISRSRRNHLSAKQVTLSFITKVAFGMAYGFLFFKFYNGDDTWQYHNFSLIEYQKLLHHPLDFLLDIRNKATGSSKLDAFYDTTGSFWNKLDEVLFIKMLAIFNVFSFGHYYVNVVIFCFVVYLGNLLLFRQLVHYFPESSPLLTGVIFYLPMSVFWLSGIRKEGILFLAICMVLYFFERILRREKRLICNSVCFLAGLIVLLLLRNFMVMCIAPSLLAWFLSNRFKWNSVITFLTIYVLSIFLFFISGKVPGFPSLPEKLTQRQYEFLSLTAKTRLPLDSLKGTASSYFQVLPQALNHSFLRPYIYESKGMLQLISAADIILFFLFVFFTGIFFKSNRRKVFQNPVILTCVFTAFFAYLIIGYTVPFPGAFVRYKAIFELLFFCVFAVTADIEKIKKTLTIKK